MPLGIGYGPTLLNLLFNSRPTLNNRPDRRNALDEDALNALENLEGPDITKLMRLRDPMSGLREGVKKPVTNILDLVGLSPEPPSTGPLNQPSLGPNSEPVAGGSISAPVTARNRIGRGIQSAASSIIPFLIARNNPEIAGGAVRQANMQNQLETDRMAQVLSEVQSRRQARVTKRGQDLDAELRREEEAGRTARSEAEINAAQKRIEDEWEFRRDEIQQNHMNRMDQIDQENEHAVALENSRREWQLLQAQVQRNFELALSKEEMDARAKSDILSAVTSMGAANLDSPNVLEQIKLLGEFYGLSDESMKEVNALVSNQRSLTAFEELSDDVQLMIREAENRGVTMELVQQIHGIRQEIKENPDLTPEQKKRLESSVMEGIKAARPRSEEGFLSTDRSSVEPKRLGLLLGSGISGAERAAAAAASRGIATPDPDNISSTISQRAVPSTPGTRRRNARVLEAIRRNRGR